MSMTEILLADVEDGDVLIHEGVERKVKIIDFSDQDMGECNDQDCCGPAYYFEVHFEDGTWFWGHGNTTFDKVK